METTKLTKAQLELKADLAAMARALEKRTPELRGSFRVLLIRRAAIQQSGGSE